MPDKGDAERSHHFIGFVFAQSADVHFRGRIESREREGAEQGPCVPSGSFGLSCSATELMVRVLASPVTIRYGAGIGPVFIAVVAGGESFASPRASPDGVDRVLPAVTRQARLTTQRATAAIAVPAIRRRLGCISERLEWTANQRLHALQSFLRFVDQARGPGVP